MSILTNQTQILSAVIFLMIQSFQTSSMTTKQVKISVIFLGNMGVGKSSIIERYAKNTYSSAQDPTLGLDRLEKTTVYNNVSYKMALWDTAGQERYRSMIPSYLKMGKFCLVTYDVTDRKSFEALGQWINLCEECKPSQSTIVIVGNKIDMGRVVLKEEAKMFAKKLGYQYFEVSARTGENINSMFNSLIKTWDVLYSHLPNIPSNNNIFPKIEQTNSEGRQSQTAIPGKDGVRIVPTKPWDKERNNCCHI